MARRDRAIHEQRRPTARSHRSLRKRASASASPDTCVRVEGSGLRVQGSGFRVQG